METTEKIVEAYVRYIKGWATISNIKCDGQYEIDLLAIDPVYLQRYHIESGVSISGGYSKLTNKPFSSETLKIRVRQAEQRRTLGYFRQRKFGAQEVKKTLRRYGFQPGKYTKVIVTWGWIQEARREAENLGIQLWDFRDLVQEIAESSKDRRTYSTDDTMQTIQLFAKALGEKK
jgi:hypothetical protein